MFITLFSVALLTALVRTVFAQSGLAILTPEFVQCESAEITWSDTGTGPYDLAIVSAQDMCGDALEDLGNQTSTTVTWTVNIPAGTQVVLYVEDADGNDAWSGTITVGGSNDTSCLADTPSTSASTSTSTPAPSVTPPPVPSSQDPVTPTTPSSPTSSAFAPVGAANAGIGGSSSGALSTHPLSAVTLFGSAVLVLVASAL